MANCVFTSKDNSGKNFSDCDFSGQDLSGYLFRSCILTGTNFSGCTFDAFTDFTGASFGASATGKATDFSGCDLSKIQCSKPANLGLYGNRTARTSLARATVPWALLGKMIQYVNLSDAVIPDLPEDLSQVMLTSVAWNNFDFKSRSLKNAHFMNCDLSGCIMTGCNLDYVSFIQVKRPYGGQNE